MKLIKFARQNLGQCLYFLSLWYITLIVINDDMWNSRMKVIEV